MARKQNVRSDRRVKRQTEAKDRLANSDQVNCGHMHTGPDQAMRCRKNG